MEYLGVILFVLMTIYHLLYVLLHKPKVIGKIIITDEDSIYLKLPDSKSLDSIRTNRYVIFRTSHK